MKKVIECNPHSFQVVVFLKLHKGPAALTNFLFISFSFAQMKTNKESARLKTTTKLN